MLKISMQFLWHRRKRLTLLLAVIILSLSLLLVIEPLFDQAEQEIRETYLARYGGHHGAILHLDAHKKELLEQKRGRIEIAYFQNYGSWAQAETGWALTLGWFSEEAIEMGHLRLLEGRFAQNADEIVLEQNAVKYSCPAGTQLGDALTFEKDGDQLQLRLVGILADYVGNWDAAWGTDVIPGYNDFPKGLLCERAGKGQTGALLYFPGVQPIKALDELLALSGELNGDHTVFHNDIVTNEKLCYFPEEGIFQSFRAFKGMVMIAVLTGTAMILLVVLGMYAGEFKKSYHTLYLLGAGNRTAGKVYGLQCLLILLMAIPLALLLAQLFAWCYSDLAIFYGANFLWPGLALLLMAVFMGFSFRTQLAPLAKQSLSRTRRGKGAKPVDYCGRLTTMLSSSFMQSNFRKVAAVLCVIAVLIASFGIAAIYSAQFQEDNMFWQNDFGISNNIGAVIYVNGTALHSYKENVFSLQQGLELYSVPGIEEIYATLAVDASIVIPHSGSSYWNQFHETSWEWKVDGIEGFPIADVTILTDENWNFFVKIIPEAAEEGYLAAYPDLPLEQMKREGSAALVLPPVGEAHYDTLEVDGELAFGRLSYPDDMNLSQVRETPEVLQYSEYALPIAYISEEERQTGLDKNYFSKPTVLIAQQTAEESPLVKGYLGFMIFLKEDISEAEYAEVEQKLAEMGAGVSGATIYSLREDRAQHMQLMEVVNFSLAMILIVFGIFAMIAIYSALYMTILQRKRSLAIYRALGLRWRTLTLAMLLELLFYWLVAILAAFVIGVLVFHFVWHIGNFFHMEKGMPLIRTLLIALAAGIPLNGAIVWSLQRGIYDQSVYEAMRFGE